MVEQIILAGEGLGILSVAGDEMNAEILVHRDPEANAVRLLVDDSGFPSWARGAAAIAIQGTFDELAAAPQ